MTESFRVEERRIGSASERIYAQIYVPDVAGRATLVIFSHELGATYRSGIPYAEEFATHGMAVCVFDFRGGSMSSRSDGSTVGMSAMTEAADVGTVLAEARGWDFVDPESIVLVGASQGGLASAIAASRHEDEIAALVLLYPALLVHDLVYEQFSSLSEVPDRFWFNGWIDVASNYVFDIWDYDIYADMPHFPHPVLILHGDHDGIVDLSYSERAFVAYPNAEFHVIRGAGHGFFGRSFSEACDLALGFFEAHGLLATMV